MDEPLQIRANHGNRSRRYTWNPAGLAQCRWFDLAEPLDDLARQPGDSLIREAARDRLAFVLPGSYDIRLLAFQVPVVLDDGFGRRDVVSGCIRVEVKRDFPALEHGL
jgi:hypothetical protein